ncbi:hypothetical protein [Rhodovulum sulfidophilum]|uniref:hypothetical protein n=1 Tax=Rhodovulum sulfidophilum TaxID=35806 RepID=UPI0019232387|nr:hypothetical protein [Rhodovulum sulfidophilum]
MQQRDNDDEFRAEVMHNGATSLVRVSDMSLPSFHRFANFVGRRILPFSNGRVVSPPGAIGHHERRCIVVATTMRSGTHVMIDLLLNNLPAYRNRPLYIDLDQHLRRGEMPVDPQAGYVVKTHYPFTMPGGKFPEDRLMGLFQNSLVITIQRDQAEILRSLARWHAATSDQILSRFGDGFDRFNAFWPGRDRMAIDHRTLFDRDAMQMLIRQIAERTGTEPARRFVPPPPRDATQRIYLMKATTRLLGARAPRINTTIFTLK